MGRRGRAEEGRERAMVDDPREPGHLGLFFERQWLHALGLAVLVLTADRAAEIETVRQGAFLGLASIAWLWAAIATAVVHQVYVWICWRAELHGQALTRWLGDGAFTAYATGFAIIGITRVVLVFVLAYANRGSLALDPVVLKAAAVVCLVPALYLFYSVRRYFSFRRAFGWDHFDPEAARDLPFVRKGIFRWTSNGMYVFGFLLLWVPGLWWASTAALLAALFNHLYIWLHYYATERPDMRRIYERPLTSAPPGP